MVAVVVVGETAVVSNQEEALVTEVGVVVVEEALETAVEEVVGGVGLVTEVAEEEGEVSFL